AALATDVTPARAVEHVLPWARRMLPAAAHGGPLLLDVRPQGGTLRRALTRALASREAQRAAAVADGILPAGWTSVVMGPDGGTVWQGVVPNHVVRGAHRATLVYLPPNVDPAQRYRMIVLLHGLRGAPGSFIGGLRLAAVADQLISTHRVPPFIAIMPPAGRTVAFAGEWTGPWETYVARAVLGWAGRPLPVRRSGSGRAIAGFSAGGYGAVDIALRHGGSFGSIASLSGYYEAPHDGSLKHA